MASPRNSFLYANTSLVLLLISLNIQLSSSADSILFANQSISGEQTLTSTGNKFVLGFFRPGNDTLLQNSYIGIWYKDVSPLTPVWVANRKTPVSNMTKSELRISDDGNLVLLDQSKSQVWSTNAKYVESNSVAVILDSGNLVLRDATDPDRIFWQSFDDPTDTWLPGSRLGLNTETGANNRLTSWKNRYDPSPGLFSLEMDSASIFIKRNSSEKYWTSGYWDGEGFDAFPNFGWSAAFMYTSNERGDYLTFFPIDNSTLLRFTIDYSGQIQELVWDGGMGWWSQYPIEQGNQCGLYSLCGPFGSCMEDNLPLCRCPTGFNVASSSDWDAGDWSSGCTRDKPLQCGTKDAFAAMIDLSLYDIPHSLEVWSAEACRVGCLNNCNCTAYAYGISCSVWYGVLYNLQQRSYGSQRDILYLRVGPPVIENSKSKKIKLIGAVLGATAGLIACMVTSFVLILRRRKENMSDKMKMLEGHLVLFTYNGLRRMTNNFSERLGGGSFGSVFKGTLPDSNLIAVKKLQGVRQGDKQFRSEVSTIGMIQHVNVVRLHGFCSEGSNKLLVYEYMPKGSLDTQLFRCCSMVLEWKMRYQIALGTARGLSYLHDKCRDCIIHCDIKPENILLDASFVPKVADFGLAKQVGREFSTVLTTMRGTIGYLAPEWISGGSITAKADVYSYGMMLFEIISGRRNTDSSDKVQYFPILAANKVADQGDILSLLDQRLEGKADLEELDRACRVACWCIQDNEDRRPSMGQVVQILEGTVTVDMPHIPRLLQILAENPESTIYYQSIIEASLARENDHSMLADMPST